PAVTLAAVDMLRSGGNAVDAAIAAIAMQGVVDPHMTGIGGDCFAIYAPASGKPIAINGSGRAPQKAELRWYLAQPMQSISDGSPHAVTVPGAVAAWCRLAADHGTKGLDEILRPAINAAENGFVIPPRSALDWARYAVHIERHKTGIPIYLPGGA